MTKTISKVGNSQGIIFDAALMDLARVKVGDQGHITACRKAERSCSCPFYNSNVSELNDSLH